MKNTDIIILTAVLTILSVALLGGAYFLGEARVASLVHQLNLAKSSYVSL